MAAAAAAVDPLAEVRVILTGPLGFTLQCANRFVATAGISSMDDCLMIQLLRGRPPAIHQAKGETYLPLPYG